MSDSLQPHGLDSPGQNFGVGSLSLLQGIFLTQGLNPGIPHCRRILYQLTHKGSLRILEWVACPFSQWIVPIQESNQGLLHCRMILYQLSCQGSIIWSSKDHHSQCWKTSKYPGMDLGYCRIILARFLIYS